MFYGIFIPIFVCVLFSLLICVFAFKGKKRLFAFIVWLAIVAAFLLWLRSEYLL